MWKTFLKIISFWTYLLILDSGVFAHACALSLDNVTKTPQQMVVMNRFYWIEWGPFLIAYAYCVRIFISVLEPHEKSLMLVEIRFSPKSPILFVDGSLSLAVALWAGHLHQLIPPWGRSLPLITSLTPTFLLVSSFHLFTSLRILSLSPLIFLTQNKI